MVGLKSIAPDEYIRIASSFKGGDDTFSALISDGLSLSGMTYLELADKLEVIPSSISRWANGESKPRPGMQQIIIAELCRMVWLVQDDHDWQMGWMDSDTPHPGFGTFGCYVDQCSKCGMYRYEFSGPSIQNPGRYEAQSCGKLIRTWT